MANHHSIGVVRTLAVAAVLAATAGCATKGFVRGEMTDLEQRMSTRVDRTDASVGEARGLAAKSGEDAQQAMFMAELARQMALGNVRREEVRGIAVQFAFDSAKLNEEARAELDAVADEVLDNASYIVLITGYTDATGDEEYNIALADRRAAAVNHYLAERLGTEFLRLARVGLGEARPLGDNSTAEGRRQNRRVDVAIVKPVPAEGDQMDTKGESGPS
jgi:outer membrane protein OmpA-like peptidoglycan-associated protein